MSMERIEEENAGAKAEMSEELNATGSIVVEAEVATETVIDERAEIVKVVEAAVESRGQLVHAWPCAFVAPASPPWSKNQRSRGSRRWSS